MHSAGLTKCLFFFLSTLEQHKIMICILVSILCKPDGQTRSPPPARTTRAKGHLNEKTDFFIIFFCERVFQA